MSAPMVGLWRNHLGAELRLIEPAHYMLRERGIHCLAEGLWWAETQALLGTSEYVVTEATLVAAGYEYVEGDK